MENGKMKNGDGKRRKKWKGSGFDFKIFCNNSISQSFTIVVAVLQSATDMDPL